MKRKYKKGALIAGEMDLMFLVLKGETVWYKDKPLNAEFVLNMSLRVIKNNVAIGNFHYCEEIL